MAVAKAVTKWPQPHSERFLQLTAEDKQRYLAKLSFIDGKDPYTLTRSEFSEDLAQLPSLK